MPKSIDDMIVPPERRKSIRDIPIPANRSRVGAPSPRNSTKDYYAPAQEARDSQDNSQEEVYERPQKPKGKKSKAKVWLSIGVIIILLAFIALTIFSGATLAYVPKSVAVSFDKDLYTADKAGNTSLVYSVVKLSKDEGTQVKATGEQSVSRKATGSIVVYNNANTQAQKLVVNTRFQTPGGLIYRATEAVTIPGKKVVGGVDQPGSVEITVIADEAGDKYNTGLTDFTLPGFKGTSNYQNIYARSKTEMTGGFVGVEKGVSKDDADKAIAQLETSLKTDLMAEATAQVPEDFVLVQSLASVTYEDLPQTAGSGTDTATMNRRGNFTGIMFKRSDLSAMLAGKKTNILANESVNIPDLDALNIAFATTAPKDLVSSTKISFSVSGQALVVWKTDEVALKSDLLGKSKKDVPSILRNYPTITSATVTVRPFWKTSLPSGSSGLTIRELPAK